MSKEQFELMRFQEMETLYSPDFTKKEATATGKQLVKNVLEMVSLRNKYNDLGPKKL